jgi:sugar phosphate isomerase/epimerase
MTRIRLAVSSWSWHEDYYQGKWSLLDLPEAAAHLGLDLVECNDFMLPPPGYSRVRRPLLSPWPGLPPDLWRYSRHSLHRLREVAAANDVRILAWTVNSDLAVSNGRWPLQWLYLRLGVAAARKLKASFLRLTLGGQANAPTSIDGLIIRRLARFIKASQRWYPGLSITVENHWGISADIGRHLRLLNGVDRSLSPPLRRYFGCCFDPGNILEEDDKWHAWRELAACANHYHFKILGPDPAGNDPALPHEALFNLLREMGYQGNVTIEFGGEGAPETAIHQAMAIFRQLNLTNN